MSDRGTPSHRIQLAMSKINWWLGRSEPRAAVLGDAGKNLTNTDEHLLRTISSNGPVRMTDLAVWQGVDKSTITPQVRRLEARGLVRRNADPADRRAALLTVTQRGRRTCERMDAAAVAFISAALQQWQENDRQAFAALLDRFVEDLTATLDER
jgi:DNA-binding MarR family transcriptional regulator